MVLCERADEVGSSRQEPYVVKREVHVPKDEKDAANEEHVHRLSESFPVDDRPSRSRWKSEHVSIKIL